jgi:very-short-patch-repair endonuclease
METITINRYKCLDNKVHAHIIEELKTLQELRELNIEKENITKFNKANHINVKGFSANFHNFKRTSDNFSIAEALFRDVLELNNINFLHEFQIKVKDILLRIHSYHLDFFIPEIKLAVEISPLFHFTYKTVAIRDKLRESLLLKHGIKTHVVKVHFRTVKGRTETYLNVKDVEKALKLIKKLKQKPNKETLLAYA